MNNAELNQWSALQLKNNHSFKSTFTPIDLAKIVGCIDLTTLNASDSPLSVSKFVEKGLEISQQNNLPNVAAFCVFSNFTEQVKNSLSNSEINTACVATAFPHGQSDLESKTLEVIHAVNDGADEIDVVINRGMVLDGDYASLAIEMRAFANASKQAHLKVILEVCELDLSQVYQSAKVAMDSGADFIKTSTGKGSSGASLEAGLVMCLAIREHYEKTQKIVGFKAAGGISTSENAMQYWNMVKFVLGEKWMNKSTFRIGASSLLKNIASDLT